jgi:hypothetical protein
VVVAAAFCAVALGAGTPLPDPGYPGFDELAKEKGRFKLTLVHPDADFSRYRALVATPIRLEFRGWGHQDGPQSTGSLVRKRDKPPTLLDRQGRQDLRRIVTDVVVMELDQLDGYELVEEAGPDTLIVSASVVDIVCRTRDAEPTVSQGTIVFDLIDAETGSIVARVSERRKVKRVKSEDSAVEPGPWADVEAWAESAAQDLRHELEEARIGF